MMEKEFCNYTQALALKELGFKEECFGYYDKDGDFYTVAVGKLLSAPLYQQAFRWFREKHNLDCNVATYALNRPKEYHWIISWTNEAKGHGLSKTYEEAESACLDKLIEITKNK